VDVTHWRVHELRAHLRERVGGSETRVDGSGDSVARSRGSPAENGEQHVAGTNAPSSATAMVRSASPS
jgi:hypothetical protein